MLMDTLFTKTSFFHNFQKKQRDFFTIFKRNDAIFSQLVWYQTPSKFSEKPLATHPTRGVLVINNMQHTLNNLELHNWCLCIK